MEEKVMKITPSEGYEIDKEKSSFENIVFKKKQETNWRKKENPFSSEKLSGYFIDNNSSIIYCTDYHNKANRNLFATEKQAKSALAMAQISQIMANDPRFGGVVTDEEWSNVNIEKYALYKYLNRIEHGSFYSRYYFLAFHTLEQCDLFLKENEDLVKDYLMID